MKTIITLKSITRNAVVLLAVMIAVIAQAQTKHVVGVTSNVFTPDELTISVGDTVEWQNTQGWHNVNGTQATFPNNPESFGNNQGSGWTYSYVFNTQGSYDYHCDPHAGLGMTGKIEVIDSNAKQLLTINFMSMNPHVGQMMNLRVVEQGSMEEVYRTSTTVTADFMLNAEVLEVGKSYYIDFFADHNGNGMYDAPPTDHAWRLELNDTMGDTTLNFTHNTGFTDIMWPYKLMLNFMSMNPHVGQMMNLRVVDQSSMEEVYRTSTMVTADFMLHAEVLESGKSYYIDFFADHNGNGMYDAPPTDHAWRLELNDAMGDTTLNFTHNTGFTDIMWPYKLMLNFMSMNPHVGQMMNLRVVDQSSMEEVYRTSTTVTADFMLHAEVLEVGKSYYIDFFADHNGNGIYDAPPTDHAWRLELNDVMGDTTLNFTHNTGFTDIKWKYLLTLSFNSMNPHIGQTLHFYLYEQGMDTVIFTSETTVMSEFSIFAPALEAGKSYTIDFYSDHNSNGTYDAPPTDHAWRLELNDVMGDTTLNFTHNTNFTDIFPLTAVEDFRTYAVKMYPNPAKSRVTLEYPDFGHKPSIRVFDLAGKARDVRISENTGSRIELDISELPIGIYLVQLQYDESVVTRKLLKK
ncbi:plastocyanin/azurin family copper-binding protein [Maribellus sediminis]|uniref:plastocyanin/azurin family copper-binding protein n=1 Tax=Maribellus sediminis TaxID=2696285 RepID=UPI00142F9D52|nr:plastocyanin/azurin family copper-binding protein [Maribellus sediminis]